MLIWNSALYFGLGSGGGPWDGGCLGGGDAEVSGEGLRVGSWVLRRGLRLYTAGLFTGRVLGGALSLLPTPECPKVESGSSFPSDLA